MLPRELAAELRRRKLRPGRFDVHGVPEVHAEQQEAAEFMTLLANAPPPALRQYQHVGAQFYGCKQGDRTEQGVFADMGAH